MVVACFIFKTMLFNKQLLYLLSALIVVISTRCVDVAAVRGWFEYGYFLSKQL